MEFEVTPLGSWIVGEERWRGGGGGVQGEAACMLLTRSSLFLLKLFYTFVLLH